MGFLNAQRGTHSETCFRQTSRTAGNPHQTKPKTNIHPKILPDLDVLYRSLQAGSWQLEWRHPAGRRWWCTRLTCLELPRLLPADELEGSSLTKAHELRPRSRISPLAVARVGSPVAWTITSAVNAAIANQRKKNPHSWATQNLHVGNMNLNLNWI